MPRPSSRAAKLESHQPKARAKKSPNAVSWSTPAAEASRFFPMAGPCPIRTHSGRAKA